MTEPDVNPEAQAASAAGVDLSDLRMMPSWVSSIGGASSGTDFSRYEERDDRGPRRGGMGGDRGDRRGPPTGRRDGPPRREGDRGDRPRPPGGSAGHGQGQGQGQRGDFRPRRDGPPGAGPRGDRDQRGGGGPRRFGDRDRSREGSRPPQREWVEIPKDVQVVIEPEDKSAEALAAHIRGTGHAFSMFDAARLVLAEGDRFHARYICASERPSGLFVTNDGGLFLTRDEALQHVLRGKALEAFYRVEEIELEEPKGEFKSVGVCGMSGELLGPPSHHSFQTSIIRMHRERFSHMPLEDYKRRVRIENEPERVAEWKEKQKKGFRWVWLKDAPEEGAEPLSFSTRAEMEAHFRRIHADEAVQERRDIHVAGNIDKAKLTHVLFILLRQGVENARKHLFDMSQKLGSNFERRGLKLFKRRAGKLFVSRVKPRAIDAGTVFSERVSKIVEVLKGKSGILLHDLVEAIEPSAVSEAPAPAAEGAEAAPAPGTPPKHAPTEAQINVIKDIRWLANEGYVIEYSDGMVFLGVQGEPQAAKPAAAPAAKESAPAASEAPAESTVVEPEAEAGPAAEVEAPAAEVVAKAEPTPELEAVVEAPSEVETPEVPASTEVSGDSEATA